MIEIHSFDEGPSYAAAVQLRDIITAAWPEANTEHFDTISIVPDQKCAGERYEDLDLLVLARFKRQLPRVAGASEFLTVRSICLIVEVKDQSQDRVRFIGTKVAVKYKDKWEDATNQSHGQMVAFGKFLRKQAIVPPHVVNLIWLRNVRERDLPRGPHNIVASDSAWSSFLTRGKPRIVRAAHGSEISAMKSGPQEDWDRAVDVFTKLLQPSRLDRAKMELVTRHFLASQRYAVNLGEQLLIFRGRGGTGKTTKLLQLGHELYTQQDARVLLLTYNKALVSDLRRLLALMKIQVGAGERRFQVLSIHSFLRQILERLGLLPDPCDDFLRRFDFYKSMLLAKVNGLNVDQLRALKSRESDILEWEFILIDEAQDWPPDERDILYSLFDYRRFILADGVAQLIRTNIAANWREGIDRECSQVVPMKEVVRSKKNLALFMRTFAERMDISGQDILPYKFSDGGKIIVLVGQGTYTRALHSELLALNSKDGNRPVDMLFCVPPRMVQKDLAGQRSSLLSQGFQTWGYKTWDGVSEDVRQSYPTDLDQLRIVQYDSSRGLEGWIVVNFGLDTFYDFKLSTYQPTSEETGKLFFDREAEANAYATRWLLIPLSRTIDTLVIQLQSAEHKVTQVLSDIRSQYKDIVEWRAAKL
jgi:hypothetical protein